MLYLGEGDIALNSQMHPPIASSFPLNYYYGSTIIMYPEVVKTVRELQVFEIRYAHAWNYKKYRQPRVIEQIARHSH